MKKLVYILLFFEIFLGCKRKSSHDQLYNAKVDIRLGTRFFSTFINEHGAAYVVKGRSSYYTEPLKVESSDTSSVFKLDSINFFFENLNRLKNKPIIETNPSDAPRIEIYYSGSKIYDSYIWDEGFWELVKPIMYQLPSGFNPFRAQEKPFG